MQFLRRAHLPRFLGRTGARSLLTCISLTVCRFLSNTHLPVGSFPSVLQNRRQNVFTLLKHVLLFISHFRYKKAIFISPAARLECGSEEDALEHCAAAGRRFCFGWCKRSMSWHLFLSDSKANFSGLLSGPVLLGMHPKANPVEMFRSGGRSKLAKTGRRGECLCLFFRNFCALTKFFQFILPLGGCRVVWGLHWADQKSSLSYFCYHPDPSPG